MTKNQFTWNPIEDLGSVLHKMCDFSQWADINVVKPLLDGIGNSVYSQTKTEIGQHGLIIHIYTQTVVLQPVYAGIESHTQIGVSWYKMGLDSTTVNTLTRLMNRMLPLLHMARKGVVFSPTEMSETVNLRIFGDLLREHPYMTASWPHKSPAPRPGELCSKFERDGWYEDGMRGDCALRTDMAKLWAQYDELVVDYYAKQAEQYRQQAEDARRREEAAAFSGLAPTGPNGISPEFLGEC